MNITQSDNPGSGKTGELQGMTVQKINEILGFEPNVDDDPDKVVNSWGFFADGVECGIWDYKGSHEFGQFSTSGPSGIFKKLFGSNYSSY